MILPFMILSQPLCISPPSAPLRDTEAIPIRQLKILSLLRLHALRASA
jgi:hypothetical protein